VTNRTAETAPKGAIVIEIPFGASIWSIFPNIAMAANAPVQAHTDTYIFTNKMKHWQITCTKWAKTYIVISISGRLKIEKERGISEWPAEGQKISLKEGEDAGVLSGFQESQSGADTLLDAAIPCLVLVILLLKKLKPGDNLSKLILLLLLRIKGERDEEHKLKAVDGTGNVGGIQAFWWWW